VAVAAQKYLKNCDLEIRHQSLCLKYKFNDENCFPWEINNCEIVTVSANEQHCPQWNCNV